MNLPRLAVATLGLFAAVSRPAAAQTRWERQVRDRLQRTLATLGGPAARRPDTAWTGVLNAEESQSFSVPLTGGVAYTIVGVCDDDCSKLHLVLSTASNNDLAVDRRSESLPVLRVTPSVTMSYRLRVELAACLVNPCWYGVAVVERD